MRWTSVLPFVAALGLGAVAVFLGKDILQSKALLARGQNSVKVVVAQRDLDPGCQLQAADLDLSTIPKESVPPTAVLNATEIVGRVVAIPISKGQMLVDSSLAAVGMGAGLQALIPHGMRAVAVEVNESSGMTGLLQPGCVVDVVATLQHEKTRESVSRTIVENVKVSAVGPRLTTKTKITDVGNAPPIKSVTLIVTPKQAEAIELAATRSRPRLVLRGTNDDAPGETPGVTVAELLRGGSEQFMEPPQQLGTMFADLLSSMQQVRLPQNTSTTQPTTQPGPAPSQVVVAERRMPLFPTARRSVQIIKGGVEYNKTFDVIATPESLAVKDAISKETASGITSKQNP